MIFQEYFRVENAWRNVVWKCTIRLACCTAVRRGKAVQSTKQAETADAPVA